MDRRGFLRAFGMGGAGAAAVAAAGTGLAGGAAVTHNVPKSQKANDVGETGQIRMPASSTENGLAGVEEGLRSLATLAAAGIQSEIEMRRARFSTKGVVVRKVHKHLYGMMANDTVRLPDGSLVLLGRHMECTFLVPDLKSLIEKSALMEMYMLPARIGLAEAIIEHCEGQSVLCYGKLPLVEPGLGAIAARGEAPEVSLRAILSFSHSSLDHLITLDTLYGVA